MWRELVITAATNDFSQQVQCAERSRQHKVESLLNRFDAPIKGKSGRSSAQVRVYVSQRAGDALDVYAASVIDNIKINSETCGTVSGGGSFPDNDELYTSVSQQAQQCVKIRHSRPRAFLPDSCSSSANLCNSISCRNRWSTVSRRFSRINVRSTSFL